MTSNTTGHTDAGSVTICDSYHYGFVTIAIRIGMSSSTSTTITNTIVVVIITTIITIFLAEATKCSL